MLNNFRKINLMYALNRYRIYLIFIILFTIMSILMPSFFSLGNMTAILKGMSMNIMAAIGFTIVLICGEIDLSIGSIITLGAMFVIGFQPQYGWIVSFIIALLAGAIVGLLNGFLIAKVKINSFVATFATMIIVQGIIFIYSKGGSISIIDYTIGDWLDNPKIPLFPPRVLITIIIVIVFELFIKKTRYGRGFYMVGSSKKSAFLSGLNTDFYLITAFIISGITSALGGVLLSMSLSSALPTLGNQSLIIIMAGAIIGGASLKGGTGSVINSMVAVVTLGAISNGLTGLGAGYAMRILASGSILAVVVLFEALSLYRRKKMIGQRSKLLKELKDKTRF